jgi:hypothetical protein
MANQEYMTWLIYKLTFRKFNFRIRSELDLSTHFHDLSVTFSALSLVHYCSGSMAHGQVVEMTLQKFHFLLLFLHLSQYIKRQRRQ